jgi:hypothetical protein
MPVLAFPEWKPDVSDYEGGGSQVITNVLPRGDGYGPFPDFSALTSALPAACRGYCFARLGDGSILIVAGTSTKLYKLSNTDLTWSDISLGAGTYSGLSAGFNWQFLQFNSLLFATQANAVLQVLDLTSPTAFANAAGSPPQASYITAINRFVVLSGLLSSPYRVQWSGLNNVNASTSWDNVTLQSNFQDMADGGLTRGAVGGDMSGIVMQDSMIRRMVFNPGSPETFDFIKISDQEGIFAPQSAVKAGGATFFISTMGFRVIQPDGSPSPVGKEKFDRYFFHDCDSANLQFCIGAADPKAPRIFWAYKSTAGTALIFDKIIIYDWQLQRATVVNMQGEYLTTLATPGITLENLDLQAPGIITISAAADNGAGAIRLTISGLTSGLTNLNNENSVEIYGVVVGSGPVINGSWPFSIHDSTHIDLTGSSSTGLNYTSGGSIGGALDALKLSLDSFSTSPLSAISLANSTHVVGFFAGANLEATLQTAERELDEAYRMRVQNVRPITDCASAAVSIITRERLQNDPVTSAEAVVDSLGNCSLNVSTRLARGKMRNPAGTTWTYATGLRPDLEREGKQ